MIPDPEEPADRRPAGALDLLVGFARAYRAWIVAGLAVLAFLGLLLWGANRPADPVLEDDGGAARETTPATPADGLDFAETARRIGEACLELLVADTGEERFAGLRGREAELDRVDGMLFVLDEPRHEEPRGFTMSGVTDPLEVGFYGADGERLGGHRMEPCEGSLTECPGYAAPAGWQFAVETAPGELPDGSLGPECEPEGGGP